MSDWTVALDIDGWMEPNELEWLYDQASRFLTVLEVGTWRGRSAAALGAGCLGRVYTVDHFQGSPSEIDGAHREVGWTDLHQEADRNLGQFPNVEILRMPSLHASRRFANESLDMVFLDGEHTRESVLIDLICWRPKVRRLLCGHDLSWPGVIEALAIYGIPFEGGPGSIWMMEVVDA